ncbi:MAG: ABC transporter substrate-binding protein, partial [Acidimicrobiales bacterium]
TSVVESTTTIEAEPADDTVAPTLRVALVALEHLDPADQRITSPSAMIAMDLLLDGLTAIDAETGHVEPDLARRWQVSDNGLRWRFDLATTGDSDQPAVTAADVKWTLERIADLGQQSIPGSSLGPVLGYADAARSGQFVGLEGVEAVRPDRLMIRLTEPFAALPALLAHPTFGVLPEGVETVLIDGDEADRHSSTFSVESSSDDGLQLIAGDRYDGAVERIEIVWVDDDAAAVAAVADGSVDLAPAAVDQRDRVDVAVVAPYGQTDFFGLNLGHPDLADPGFRRAIVQAVDRRQLATPVSDDVATPVTGLIPAPGRDVCGDACQFDPDVAAQTVEFVFGDAVVPTIGIDYLADDEAEAAIAEALAGDLEASGVPTELRPATVIELEERIAAGEHMLFRFGWVPGYLDDQAWIDSLFRSDGPDNVFNLAESEVDDLIAELSAVTDPEDRRAIAEDLEREVLTQYVVLPVLARQQVMARAEGVDGVELRSDGTFDPGLVTID